MSESQSDCTVMTLNIKSLPHTFTRLNLAIHKNAVQYLITTSEEVTSETSKTI